MSSSVTCFKPKNHPTFILSRSSKKLGILSSGSNSNLGAVWESVCGSPCFSKL
jgi:hypothetical protein